MSEHKKFELHAAGTAELSDLERSRLAHSLAKAVHNRPDTFIGKVRQTMRELFVGIPLIAETVPMSPKRISRSRGVREIADADIQDFIRFEKDKHLCTVTLNGEVAAAAGYEKSQDKHPVDGKDIVELRCLIVLPKFRGQGISTPLLNAVYDAARREYPTAYIVLNTKNPAVKSWCAKRSFQEFTLDELVEFWNLQDKPKGKENLRKEMQEWSTFIESP